MNLPLIKCKGQIDYILGNIMGFLLCFNFKASNEYNCVIKVFALGIFFQLPSLYITFIFKYI